MSFLVGALGQLAAPLLKQAGGYLFDKAKPMLSRIGNYFSGSLGGQKSGLGRSVMDRLYQHGSNAAFGGMQKFAQSDYLKRKMPILAPQMGQAAQYMKERLDSGYQAMVNGGTSGSAVNTGATKMDGIERQR